MRKGKRILAIVGVAMSLALIGCSGEDEGLTDDLVSISADKELSDDGNYVIVAELKDGVKNVEYTLIENGKIIDVKEDIQESALKEYVMQGKKAGEYKYTLNAKDDKDNEVSKEVTVEVKSDSKKSENTTDSKEDQDSKDNEEKKESTDSNSSEKVQGTWDADSKDYKAGDEVTYNDKTYTCLQGHTSQESWNPVSTPALWKEKK